MGVRRMAEIVTTAGYSPEEQAAYCANYCLPDEHHPACARRDVAESGLERIWKEADAKLTLEERFEARRAAGMNPDETPFDPQSTEVEGRQG